jgi:hypothetical protein
LGTVASPYKVGIKTTMADSGRFMMSTGTSVIFNGFEASEDTTTRTLWLSATPTTNITWTKIIDTTFNRKNGRARIQRLDIPGILVTDFCFTTDRIRDGVAQVIGGQLYNSLILSYDLK